MRCNQTEDSALQYGVVQTLANLTTYRRRLSEEQQQLKKLQEFAGEKKVKVRLPAAARTLSACVISFRLDSLSLTLLYAGAPGRRRRPRGQARHRGA